MARHRKRGVIQVIITIFLWANVPSWEKMVLEIINNDPGKMAWFWIEIARFLLRNWVIISIIILAESLYAIIENRNLVRDIVTWVSEAIENR